MPVASGSGGALLFLHWSTFGCYRRLILGFNINMRTALGLFLVSLFPLIPAHAQFSGRVTGSVVDASGAAIVGADVELSLAGGKRALLAVKTSSDGTFNFIAVRPAEYDLSVDAKGFLKAIVRNITADAARETTVPQIKLQLPTVSQ